MTRKTRLAEVKAKQLAGELVDMAEVEAKWRLACRLIRSRILSVAEKMRDLTPQQRLMLLQVQAESHDAATKIFGKDLPHLQMPGAWIEIIEIMPLPGM